MTASIALNRLMASTAAARQTEDAFDDALALYWQTTGQSRAWARTSVRRALAAMRDAWHVSNSRRDEYRSPEGKEVTPKKARGRHGAMPYSRERSALIDEGFRLEEYLRHLGAVAVACGSLNAQAMSHVEEAISLLAAQKADHEVRYTALDAHEEAEDLIFDHVAEQDLFSTLGEHIARAPQPGKASRARRVANPDELRRQTSLKLPFEGGQKQTVENGAASRADEKKRNLVQREA